MLQYPPACGPPRGAGSVRRGLKVSPRPRLEKTAVALRKVPGALAAGLLASLAAHTALFGGSHAMGGAYHELFLQAALTIVVGAGLLFASLAWSGARLTADGSILAARLCSRFPSIGAVAGSSLLWYVAGEALERKHAGPPVAVVLLILALAAWLVTRLGSGLARLLARAVLTIARVAFSPRLPIWNHRAESRPIFRRVPLARRRFARPPPIAFALVSRA
jgi:hypothetical protein